MRLNFRRSRSRSPLNAGRLRECSRVHPGRGDDLGLTQAFERGCATGYFIPMTIESGPIRCSARVLANPASVIQAMQSVPHISSSSTVEATRPSRTDPAGGRQRLPPDPGESPHPAARKALLSQQIPAHPRSPVAPVLLIGLQVGVFCRLNRQILRGFGPANGQPRLSSADRGNACKSALRGQRGLAFAPEQTRAGVRSGNMRR